MTAACLIAIFMPAVEATIVSTAMPTIVADLGGFSLYSWVFAGYFLMQAISTPIYGRLADLFGRKRVFYAGAGIFLIGSAACGFAWGMVPLVIFRILQGVGAGALQSVPITIIGDLYSARDRARMQGWLSGVWGIAAIIGPLLGAFIVEYLSWPLVFWINLPIGVASMAMLAVFLKERIEPRRHDVDYLGALLLTLGVGAPMIVLVQAGSLDSWEISSLLVLGAVALAALVAHERRVLEPIVPLRLWRKREIAVGNFGGLCTGAVLMSVIVFLPAYIQGVMGLGPITAGVVIGTQAMSWSIAAVVAGWVMVRTSYRVAGAIGGLALMAGAGILIALDPGRGLLWAIGGAAIVGIGMGFANTTFTVSVQASVEWNERGVATSSTLFMRTIGQTLGSALGGAILNLGISRHAPEAVDAVNRLFEPGMRESLGASGIANLSQAIATSLHDVFLITGILATAVLLITLRLPAGLSPTRPAKTA